MPRLPALPARQRRLVAVGHRRVGVRLVAAGEVRALRPVVAGAGHAVEVGPAQRRRALDDPVGDAGDGGVERHGYLLRFSRRSGRSPGRARSATARTGASATGPSASAVSSAASLSAPVIRMWITEARAQHRRGQRQPRLGLARRVDLDERRRVVGASAAASSGAPGKSEAVCMSAPIPSTSTSIGSAAADPARSSRRAIGS